MAAAGLYASLGLANASATFTFTPTSLSFPVTIVGSTSAAETTTVKNTGTTSASITKISLTGINTADFAVSAKTCAASLAAGATCTVSVTFTPLGSGIRVASLTFTDSATGSPQTVNLQGTAQSSTQSISFYPTSLAFPATTVGTISSSLSTTVANYGAATISITGVHLQGVDLGDFAITGNNCTTLAQGQTCVVSVSFSPALSGVLQANLEFTDTGTGSPQAVPVVGTAQSATHSISLSPTSTSFGTQNVGSTTNASYFSVSNNGTAAVTYTRAAITGTNAADFSVNSQTSCTNGGVLNPNATCYVYVTFTPSAIGVRTATLNISDSATGSPQTATLYGVGQAATNTLSFSKGTLDLGVEPIGVTSGQTYVGVVNTGTNPIPFNSVTIGGADASDFAISSNGCSGTLNPLQACDEYVTFTPLAKGQRTATLNFSDSATGSPQTVSLIGTGETDTESLSFNYLDYGFGQVAVGSTSNTYFESVYNAGDLPITFSSIAITGTNAADFTITNEGCPIAPSTLAPNQTCYVYVAFSPSAAGVRSAGLRFTDTGSGSPQTIGLGGLGEAQMLTLTFSAPNLIFPGVVVGSSGGTQNVTVTNTGDEPVTFSSVSLTGANASSFVIQSNGCSTVAAGQTCAVYVYSAPTTAGVQTAALSFTDGAAGSPQSLPLAGDGEPAAPALSLNPTDVDFGYGVVGVTSPTTSVSATNNSGSAVSIAFQVVGPNAPDFIVTSNTCTGTLAGNGSCSLKVAFKAAAMASRTAALRFTVAGVSQDLLVSGIGSSAAKLLTIQSAADFGVAAVGSTSKQIPISIENTGGVPVSITGYSVAGTDPTDFSVASTTCGATLAPLVMCDVQMVFTPTAGGERTATLRVSDSATGSPQAVGLSGVGEANLLALTVPASLDLGSTLPGSPVSTNLLVVNDGIGTITITKAAITGANASDFALNYNPCIALNGDTTCNIQISFNPSAAGVRTATLSLTDNASGSPQTVTLVGVGQPSTKGLAVPSALAFPSINVGSYSSQNLNLQNTGTITVTVSNVAISGANASDFTVFNACPSIGAGSTCSLQVAFVPTAAGLRLANLTITDNATGSPQRVSLTGVGQALNASLSLPQDLAFPTTTIGSYTQENFAIYNIGNVPIVFTSVAITGTNPTDFLLLSSCSILNPGAGCTIYVDFIPAGAGTRIATLQFTDNATGSPQSVTLTGIGQSKTNTAALTPSSLTFSAQAVGTQSGGQYVYVTNDGAQPVTVSKVTIGGADPTDFQIIYNTCAGITLNQNQYCYAEIAFTPTATGARSATVTATDNATGGSQSATLSGTGK